MLHRSFVFLLIAVLPGAVSADDARKLRIEAVAPVQAAVNSESVRERKALPEEIHDQLHEDWEYYPLRSVTMRLDPGDTNGILSSGGMRRGHPVTHLPSLDVGNLREVLGRELSPLAVDEQSGWSDLHWAAALNLPELAELLLELGVEVDARLYPSYPDWGWRGEIQDKLLETLGFNLRLYDETPLQIAAQTDALEVANILIARGADIHAERCQYEGGWTPLDTAVDANAMSVATMLFERIAGNLEQGDVNSWLDHAAYRNATEVAAMLVDRGADISAIGEFGRTPLQSAAYGNASGVAAMLVDRGADINAKSEFGWTPLHFAACGHHDSSQEAAAVLIERGADLNAKNVSGVTPLHLATACHATGIVEKLIEHGADVHAKNGDGWSPLHVAAAEGHDRLAAILIEGGADVHAKGGDGRTPLAFAQEKNHREVATLLKQQSGSFFDSVEIVDRHP